MQNKQCQQCHKTFKIEDQDLDFYQRIDVPAPTLCPDCRQQRRLSWCNEMTLYPATCLICKKNILSIFSPNSNIKVCCRDCWWSDKYDGTKYQQEINSRENFFTQLDRLNHQVLHVATSTAGRLDNCDYVHYCGDSKNCYLTFHADFNENCLYAYGLKKCKDCIDAFNNFDCELCYQCIDCHNCYNLKWSQDCVACYESYFLKDCVGCRNCFGAVGLRNQEYYFFDVQLSKTEYEKKMHEINTGSYLELEKWLKKASEFREKHFYKYMQGLKNEKATGNNLNYNKNLLDSFDCDEVENGRYCYQLYLVAKDCYDYYQYGMNSQLIYEGTIIGGGCNNLKFCHYCFNKSWNLEYCIECASCKNCFGCISLHKKEFCILNKQYSEKEYFDLMGKLKTKMKQSNEYGEYFPASISSFGYNETSAAWWYPLKKEEAIARKFKWQEHMPETKGKETVLEIPDNIKDIPNNIVKEILICGECHKNYKIITQELEFYQKNNIPLPRKCFYCRHLARRFLRNPRSLWHRQCQKPDCHNTFETTYSPERKELVYCEDCYLSAVM